MANEYTPQFQSDPGSTKDKYNTIINNEPGPPDSFLGAYYCRIMLGKYQRTRPFEPETWSPNKVLFLPLPSTLSDDSRAEFSEESLESIGDLMNLDAATGVGSILLRKSGAALEKVSGSLIAGAFGDTGLKVKEMLKGASGITAEKLTSAIQQFSGVAPNPNPSVQFTGPSLRSFDFSWTFNPRSKEESDKVDLLIKQLKSSALPSHTFDGSTAILNYPDLCQINFFPWDSGGSPSTWGWTDNSIIRIKKCFIKNVSVNYSDQGIPAFFEGSQRPVSYRLSLTLQETEYMLSKDWGGNSWSKPISDLEVANYVTDLIEGFSNFVVPGSGILIDIAQGFANLGAEGAE